MWFSGGATALAQEALRKAEAAATEIAVTGTAFKSHMEYCERRDRERAADQRDWREGLGRRLDKQDRIMWGALASALIAALSVAAWALSHLPAFTLLAK